jgi:hypothetical protein
MKTFEIFYITDANSEKQIYSIVECKNIKLTSAYKELKKSFEIGLIYGFGYNIKNK